MESQVPFISIPQVVREQELAALSLHEFAPAYERLATKLAETKKFIQACAGGDLTGKGPHLVALGAALLELATARAVLESALGQVEMALDSGVSRNAFVLSMLKLDAVLSRRLLRETGAVLTSSRLLVESTQSIWQAEVDELLNFERQLDNY